MAFFRKYSLQQGVIMPKFSLCYNLMLPASTVIHKTLGKLEMPQTSSFMSLQETNFLFEKTEIFILEINYNHTGVKLR